MRTARRNEETGDQEGCDGTSCHVRIRVGDVVEHGKPQERITEAEDCASHNWRPV